MLLDDLAMEELLATITVTYHPDLNLLQRQLQALPKTATKIIVDNASPPYTREGLRKLVGQYSNFHLIDNPVNIGLSAAINQGIALIRQLRPAAKYCLLLDQDSEPTHGSVMALIAGYRYLESQGIRVGCVGPLLIDAVTGISHGFHQMTSLRWRRVYPAPGSLLPIPCANLNGSGTLAAIELLQKLGGLDESFFIDHVDTEWSFRVLSHGFSLWGIPKAIFYHRMGQTSIAYWLFGWHVWPSRSAVRHRYLFRNAIWLMRRSYVPRVWKSWCTLKLATTFVIHALFDVDRKAQVRSMLAGLREGIKTSPQIQRSYDFSDNRRLDP